MIAETIVALSSGNVPSGVAVVRISGAACRHIADAMLDSLPHPRIAAVKSIFRAATLEELDRGLVIWFPGPSSFTGEDCLEMQLHGGRAVVAAVLDSLTSIAGVRLADAGEFSRRAFENGKLDLTEIEGIADLVSSETEAQRKQALSQSRGDSRETYENWRSRLIRMRALIEAELDFSEEEDIPEEISREGFSQIQAIRSEIADHLDDNRVGEIIRDGFKIALMGKPNAGKSSLLNALAKREVAIVTDSAGTTRDVLDVHLNMDGYSVVISDTAGLRDSDDVVEVEGIRRANERGSEADLVIWLTDLMDPDDVPELTFDNVIYLISKDDSCSVDPDRSISVNVDNGLDGLLSLLSSRLKSKLDGNNSVLISRLRYREALIDCLDHLDSVLNNSENGIELKAETLRHASDSIGRITGKIDVEDLLDVIFSEFCVGK